MGRPPKHPSLRMEIDLRIPVTKGQRNLIFGVAQVSGLEMASWARQILLKAALDTIDEKTKVKYDGNAKSIFKPL